MNNDQTMSRAFCIWENLVLPLVGCYFQCNAAVCTHLCSANGYAAIVGVVPREPMDNNGGGGAKCHMPKLLIPDILFSVKLF